MTQFTDLPDHFKDVVHATFDRQSRFGAMMRCILMGRDQSLEPGWPRFIGKASRTSDNLLMWDFLTASGDYHHGALAGSWEDFMGNVLGIMKHLRWCRLKQANGGTQAIPLSEGGRIKMVAFQNALNAGITSYSGSTISFLKETLGRTRLIGAGGPDIPVR